MLPLSSTPQQTAKIESKRNGRQTHWQREKREREKNEKETKRKCNKNAKSQMESNM